MSDCPSIQCCPDAQFKDFAQFGQIVETVYWNTRQCATAVCPTDLSAVSTVCKDAGKYSSTVSQADADALALSAAYDEAIGNLGCKYVSTQIATIDCTNNVPVNQVPLMTSNTAPSGTCSGAGGPNDYYLAFDRNVNTYWQGVSGQPTLQYHFPSAVAITGYIVTLYPRHIPAVSSIEVNVAWVLQGSNNGLIWITLDTQNSVTFSNLVTDAKQFSFTNTTTYNYYRLVITSTTYLPSTVSSVIRIAGLELLAAETTHVSASATAVSLISQADADAKAYAAALAQCSCP